MTQNGKIRNDDLISWDVKYYKDPAASGYISHFRTSCCAGSGNDAYCLPAGGVSCVVPTYPPFYQTRNRGKTWEQVKSYTYYGMQENFKEYLYKSSCKMNNGIVQANVVSALYWAKDGSCPESNYNTNDSGKTWVYAP